MKAVVQRVSSAGVTIGGEDISSIGHGLLVLLGVEQGDDRQKCEFVAKKIASLRIFSDADDKMNLSVGEVGGKILAVSNFTVCGDCSHGRRPSFINAARPQDAIPLYDYFCELVALHSGVEVLRGVFGADMAVSLVNDGPVTVIVEN